MAFAVVVDVFDAIENEPTKEKKLEMLTDFFNFGAGIESERFGVHYSFVVESTGRRQ